ncbi:MAG: GWxTD domain-containing protein [Bacteroidota bacterium]
MRRHFYSARLATLVVTLLWTCSAGFAQVENIQTKRVELPDFFLDALSFSGDTLGSRLDVYLQVPYEKLHFLRAGAGFNAKYEVTVGLFLPDNNLVTEKSWVEDVNVATFEESVSRGAYNLSERSFYLRPAKYTLRVQVRDSESKQTSQIDRALVVPNFAERDLSISDIMIVNKLSVEGGKKNIVPNISANVGEETGNIYLFFEVYNRTDLDTIDLKYSVVNPKRVELISSSQLEPISKLRTQVFLKLDSLSLPVGNYRFALEARRPVHDQKPGDEERPLLAIAEKPFNVHWAGMPLSIANMELAIDQMRYIAKDKESDYIKSAPTVEEKQKRFLEFWNKRDPTPGTDRNELMEEYFNRVDYANTHFGHYVDGWKTDMGMVFIILGAPNTVDRHPFEYDSKPYEVWYYYDRNRRYVFLDETGFGDYRLISPLGDLWQRY